jgi:hypothetical protein
VLRAQIHSPVKQRLKCDTVRFPDRQRGISKINFAEKSTGTGNTTNLLDQNKAIFWLDHGGTGRLHV